MTRGSNGSLGGNASSPHFVLSFVFLLIIFIGQSPFASAQGLVGAYGFNEGTGSTTADLSGSGNTGTLSSATWTSSAKFGNALSFNGSTGRVDIADSASLDLVSGMTLEAWVYPTAAGSVRTVLYKEYSSGLVYALFASNGSSRPYASIRLGSGVVSVTGPSSLTLNGWSHLAATYDGAKLFCTSTARKSPARASPAPSLHPADPSGLVETRFQVTTSRVASTKFACSTRRGLPPKSQQIWQGRWILFLRRSLPSRPLPARPELAGPRR